MKALVTGASGFVGNYMVKHLEGLGYEVYTWGRPHSNAIIDIAKNSHVCIAPNDEEMMIKELNKFQPNQIYHLAGFSSVSESWKRQAEVFEANVINTVHLLEAIRKSQIRETARIIITGSSEEYGRIDARMPISEASQNNPISPYGVSKLTVNLLTNHYFNAHNINVIHVRPFNHIGPGQRLGFVTSDFAKQIAEIEDHIIDPVVRVGNLSSERDFTDVRDIVQGYEMLAVSGEAGQTYNVCSGKPVSIQSILEMYIQLSFRKDIQIIKDEKLFRPIDIPFYVGDPEKIKKAVNWSNRIPLVKSLDDVLNYWREKVRSSKEFIHNA